MVYLHQELASAGWRQLSLAEQLGNIGSEVKRALEWRDRDQKTYQMAIRRALELFDLTLADSRWRMRLKEIARARELLCDSIEGGREYHSTLEALDRYFFYFAVKAQIEKSLKN